MNPSSFGLGEQNRSSYGLPRSMFPKPISGTCPTIRKNRAVQHLPLVGEMVDAIPKRTLAFTAARCTITRTEQRSGMIDGRSRGPCRAASWGRAFAPAEIRRTASLPVSPGSAIRSQDGPEESHDMFVVVSGNRIIGRSTTLHGADAIRQQRGRGVLCELLCPADIDPDRELSGSAKQPRKSSKSATRMKRQRAAG